MSVVMISLGVLCLTLAPIAIWGRNLVLNTERYVQTLEPLASDTGVQNALIDAVDRKVQSHLDVTSLIDDVLPPRAAEALAGPLQSATKVLINTITTDYVRSKAFATLWVTINRLAHEQIDNLLTGKSTANGSVAIRSGTVFLDLSHLVENVKARLVDAGITVASKIPAVGATLEIAHVNGLTKAQRAVRALDAAADCFRG